MHWIDPRSLPATRGTVTQFVMNRDGELDGLLLTIGSDTKLVHFPPHMGGEIEPALKVGDVVTVHGVKPRGAEVIAAVSLLTAIGTEILDHGPDAPHIGSVHADEETVQHDAEARGTVRLSLFGPKGELRGAVIEDGTVIRVGKKEAGTFADLLQPGATLAVRGTAIICRHGVMLDAEVIGPDADHLKPLKQKKEDKPEKPKKHDDEAHADA